MNIALLFEQSGTFKNILRAKGHNAKDFDISNDYGETDYIIDLFKYIQTTDMSRINRADLVIAFFPCTWFSNQNDLIYSGKVYQFKKWSDEKIQAYIEDRYNTYLTVKQILLTMVRKLHVPLIIENPNSTRIVEILGTENSVLHKRSKYGDYYDKPTRYYCYNGAEIGQLKEIKNDIHMRIKYTNDENMKQIKGTRKMKRSMISPLYVNNLVNHITVNGEPL